MRIGIDLGGTKIEARALDLRGNEQLRMRCSTPQGNYQGTLDALVDLVGRVEAQLGRTAPVGICIPGTLSRDTGRVKNANSTCLIGRDLKGDLEARLARPLGFANDADCLALSEATDGAAAGARSMFGVILGTGVGGGIVIDGRLLQGPNGIAGEWGHNPLPWPGPEDLPAPACYCGRRGCIETYLCGPGLVRDFRHHGGNPAFEAVEIAAAADTGEARANRALERYCERLARSLATVINLIDPEVIVLGGGLSNIPLLYREVPRRWSPWVFSDRVHTRLVPALHGDSSGVRGAARLWPSD